ncbi:MAG: class I SAM-dependent methyltransferase [Mariprofundus sp.]|nr:class I SAM-dependent methyltransferase [Mariprofundus sp.]
MGLSPELYGYLLSMGLREPDVLQQLREATEKEDMSVMRSAPEQGQFMAMLLRLTGAKRALEIGTYTGYATLWMALALPDDGEIVSCDVSEQWTALARQYWAIAGVDDKIHLHLRPAMETLHTLLAEGEQGRFDFVFIDADKINYQPYFEACIQLVRPGGLIVVDNVLWDGSVIDPANHDASTEAIRVFNQSLANDARVDICMLPVADGITLAQKR